VTIRTHSSFNLGFSIAQARIYIGFTFDRCPIVMLWRLEAAEGVTRAVAIVE
jgi:hypothetical protein